MYHSPVFCKRHISILSRAWDTFLYSLDTIYLATVLCTMHTTCFDSIFYILLLLCFCALYDLNEVFLFFIYNQSHIGCAKGWWSQRLRIKSIFLDSPIQVMVGQEPNPAVTGQKVGPVRTGHQSIPGLIIQCAFCNVVPALITRTDTHTKFHPHMSPLFEININPSSSSQNERKAKGIFDCCFDYKLESTMALHTRTLLSSAFYFIMCFVGERLSCVWGRFGEGWRRDRWAVLHICTGWTSKRRHRRKYM